MIAWLKNIFGFGQPRIEEPAPIVDEKFEAMLRNQPVIEVRKKPGRKPGNPQTIRAPQLKKKPGRPRKPRHD